MSDDQVKEGTITSPDPFRMLRIFIEIIFADDPELTNTEYFTPNHFDQLFSNFKTFFDWVKIGSFFFSNFMTESKSSFSKLFDINGCKKFFIKLLIV